MAQSNFDRRRINGPDDTFQPIFDSDDEEETRWRPGNPRKGREPREIRRICTLSILPAALPSPLTHLCCKKS